jgi:hypothetical protein
VQALHVVDLDAAEVLGARRVDADLDVVVARDGVALARLLVEVDLVAEPGAPPPTTATRSACSGPRPSRVRIERTISKALGVKVTTLGSALSAMPEN